MKEEDKDLFNKLKKQLLMIDPVEFVETYLTLDGQPFRLKGSGYKPYVEIYRYMGIKALERNAKPLILVTARQNAKTTLLAAIEMYFMGCGLFGKNGKFPIRIMHAFPQLEIAAAYSKTKLNPMISSSVPVEGQLNQKTKTPKSFMQSLLDGSNPANDSLSYKQFQGGNHIWVESTGMNADRIRGRTCDVMFFDETQDISGTAITNATKILAASKYGAPGDGVQAYVGTPKRKGSDFHKMWLSSNQQYYHLGCEKCEKYFPLETPESDDWEKIWVYEFTVKCIHCNHLQDKRAAAERGKWFATKPDDESLMVGFHLNQLYMPHFSKEKVLSEKPGTHPINTERAYRNEVLGEFYQGDASPITPEDIKENCADHERKFRARIMPKEEELVLLGLDFGQKSDLEKLADSDKVKSQGTSYSTAVILTVKGPNLFSIEFASKFKRNDLESKKSFIEQLMRQYSVDLAVGDIGYSNDLSEILQNIYGEKYITTRASGKLTNHTKYMPDVFPREIMFEKSHYFGEMFDLLKKGQIKFPFGSYEQIAWLIDHCSSMEIKPSISRTGDASINYVKGSTPNDGFCALMNAYIGYKYIITNGFTSNNPMMFKKINKDDNKPLITLGSCKR